MRAIVLALAVFVAPVSAGEAVFQMMPQAANLTAREAVLAYGTAPWELVNSPQEAAMFVAMTRAPAYCVSQADGVVLDHVVVRLFQLAAPGEKLPTGEGSPELTIVRPNEKAM